MHTSKLLRMLALVFALTLTAAACSSSDDSDVASGDGSDDATSESDTTEDSADDASDDTADDGDDQGDSDSGDGADADLGDVFSGDCREAVEAFSSVQSSFAGAFTGSFGSEDFENAGDALDELADAAPDAIKDAFAVYADELGAYFDAIAGIDVSSLASGPPDQDTIQALTEASEAVDEAALEDASQEIGTYFEDACAG